MSRNSPFSSFVRLGLMGLATLLLVATLAPQAEALSPQAAEFLRSIGLDPNSEAVRIADADGQISVIYHGDPKNFSLEGLAAERQTNAVKQFVAMRSFIRRLKADYANTKFPTVDYNPDYLKPEERALVGRKVRDEPPKAR